ncbi:MAG TPA: VWA domain-containing protein [Gaiellales bacterium]
MTARGSLAAGAAAIAAIALLVAVANPRIGSHPRRTVLALDRSASIDSAMRTTEARWQRALAGRPDACSDPCRAIGFSSTATALPIAAAGRTGGATDLEQGLAAAVAAAPAGGRVVLLSDGLETEGDASAAVAAARARGVRIDAVALADPGRRDAAVTRLDAPRTVRRGDTITLLVTVRSTAVGAASLVVTHDGGRPAAELIGLHRGDNPYTLSYTAARTGWHSFSVRVRLAGDQRPGNDRSTVSVDVGSSPRAVVVSSAASPPVATILRAHGIPMTVEQADELPATAAGYASIDALVLDDLPANRLGAAQVAALDGAVRDGGLGLLTLGGRHAYSLGGYARSPLNDLLPLASRTPGDLQRRNLAIELVLDRSGSMSDTAGGVRKIVMAQSAARQAARFVASHQDELGVVDFDIVPHVLLPQRRIAVGSLTRAVDARIGGLQAGGGTDIYLALRAGYRQLLASHSANRHLILLTDGISQPHDYTALLRQLASRHISVATVALGSDVDSDLLREISRATGGNAYRTSNARDLPRIFVKETRLSAKPVQIAGRQQVVARDSSPIVRSLAGRRLPALSGNVVTTLKVGAQLELAARSGTATSNPALAEWGLGLGRVVSWTPGLGAPWATAWTAETSLWNDVVRFVARGLPPPEIDATASEDGSTSLRVDLGAAAPTVRTTIAASLEGAGGSSTPVELRETSPSVYTDDAPARATGSYGLTLALPAALGGRRRVLVDVPYPAELRPGDGGTGTLAQVATQTGGRLLTEAAARAFGREPRSLRTPLLLLALLSFLVSVALRLVVRTSRSRAAPGSVPVPERPLTRR